MQEIGLVSRFQAAPKETCVLAVKIIFKYIKGALDFNLWYSRGEIFTLTTYTDAYWTCSIDDRKSTSGGELFLRNNLVYWLRKKQPLVSLSISEAEHITVTSCCIQVLWMNLTLRDIEVEYDHPISILFDNTNGLNLSKNPIMHLRTKHIPIKHNFLG